METRNYYKILLVIFILLSWSSFFLGFYLDENSAGAGGYRGDWKFLWPNLQVFLNNDVLSAIKDENFLTNRPPLSYILHKFLNPFVENEIHFRRSVFFISLTVPIIFYFFLKKKYQQEDNLILFLLSSTVLLSPYFRTSSYWGLEENYGFICLLLSSIFLNLFLSKNNEKKNTNYLSLFFCIFFSSACVYFDQKLLIVPIICFFTIIASQKNKIRIFSTLLYLLMSSPYIYLINVWGGIFPTELTTTRKLGDAIYLDHIGYASTIIAFYLIPLLIFKENSIKIMIQNFFKKKESYYLILLPLIYIIYLMLISYFFEKDPINTNVHLGKGMVHKISFILFDNIFIKKIFIYLSFFVSALVILIFVDKNFKDKLILSYFLIIALFIYPLMQEYFDPIILLMVFTFFSTKLFINFKNVTILFFYLSTLLLASNIYYYNLLK